MLHLYATPDETNFCKLIKPFTGNHRVHVFLEAPLTVTQVRLAAQSMKADAVICCSQPLLQLLLFKTDGITQSVSLDDYAGSVIYHEDVTYLVCNPPSHIITTASGSFLWSRYLSKILSPNNWPQQPVFRWSLANASNVETLYQQHFVNCDLIAVDIETVNKPFRAITCCSFAAVAFKPDSNGCPYTVFTIVIPLGYAEKGEHDFMLAWLRKLCATPQPKIFQNGKYDNFWLIYYHAPVTNWLLDTAHMFHSWFSELPKRLDFIASFSIRDSQFWKNEKSGDREAYFRYNAKDSYNTAIACINILNEWPDWARDNYKDAEFPTVFPCLLAELTGMVGDAGRFVEMKGVLEKSLAEQQKEFAVATATPQVNPNSAKQMRVLFDIYGGKDIAGTGKIPLDKFAARHPLNKFFADRITKYRSTLKLISSYLKDGVMIEGNSILYSLNPHNTDTGRLTGKESAFWCGPPIHGIPRDKEDEEYNIKELFIAPSGFLIGECDREKAESVGTAYITGDEKLIEAVNSQRDFHANNAAAFFGLSYDDIYDDVKKKAKDKPLRDLSKRTNHGANYLMGAGVLLDTMGIANVIRAKKLLHLPDTMRLLEVTEYLLRRFEETYPVLRGAYAQWVRSQVVTVRMLIGATGWVRYCFDNPAKDKRALNSYVAHNAQSLNAMELNQAWLRVFKEVWLPNQKDFRLCCQIHDSIVFYYRQGRVDLAWEVKRCMEHPLEVTDFRGTKRTMLIPSALSAEATRWSDTKRLFVEGTTA